MRKLTDEDIDFFAAVMPEWCGKTPEEGKKKAAEWQKIRRNEKRQEGKRCISNME